MVRKHSLEFTHLWEGAFVCRCPLASSFLPCSPYPCFSQSSWGDLLQKLTVPWFHSAKNCFDMSLVLIFSQSFFSRFKQKHIFYKHVVTSCLLPFAKFLVFVFLRCHSLVLTAGSLSLSVPQSQGEVCPFCCISD